LASFIGLPAAEDQRKHGGSPKEYQMSLVFQFAFLPPATEVQRNTSGSPTEDQNEGYSANDSSAAPRITEVLVEVVDSFFSLYSPFDSRQK
jgi:hypothetical protein